MIKGYESGQEHSEVSYFNCKVECSIPSKCLHGMFNNENLTMNIKKLDQYYKQKLTPADLDERHFINRDKANETPYKLSPF